MEHKRRSNSVISKTVIPTVAEGSIYSASANSGFHNSKLKIHNSKFSVPSVDDKEMQNKPNLQQQALPLLRGRGLFAFILALKKGGKKRQKMVQFGTKMAYFWTTLASYWTSLASFGTTLATQKHHKTAFITLKTNKTQNFRIQFHKK